MPAEDHIAQLITELYGPDDKEAAAALLKLSSHDPNSMEAMREIAQMVVYKTAPDPNQQCYTYSMQEVDLQKFLFKASKGNLDRAANILMDMYLNASEYNNIITVMLMDREVCLESFRSIAKIIFEARF